ncbi:MAG: type II toxin-antitoxin system HicB family antitoxin [Acidobacteria bacterium]|nr:type II toxin-antitoxin system HicB family antitoxin [Acidobacteriota bacterium]
MEIFDLELVIEELKDGGDYRYLATCSELPSLLVAGTTVEEIIEEAPRVASALIASMKASGDPLPDRIRRFKEFPFTSHVAVVV